MNRLEVLREFINKDLLEVEDLETRHVAYIHLYGVSQFAALLAKKRELNEEIAAMAGMLHDIYTYKEGSSLNHAKHGSVLSRIILKRLEITTEEETDLICEAIFNHSDKLNTHDSYSELLKDADVLQHHLYNPSFKTANKEIKRCEHILKELGLQ